MPTLIVQLTWRRLVPLGFFCAFAASLSTSAPSSTAKRHPVGHQDIGIAKTQDNNSNNNNNNILLLEDLHKWADDHGVERKVKVQLEEMAGGGRGLIATERIEADKVVVKVPLSAVIRLESAVASTNNNVNEGKASLFRSGNYDEDDQWAGILAKRLWEESCHGTDSSWAPYIANLPSEAPLTPCRWNSRQRQALQNDNFVTQIQENAAWRIRQVKQQNIPNQHRTDYLKFLDLVCSRTLKGRDGSRQLVPLIDIANHEPSEAGGGHFYVDNEAVYLVAGSRGVNQGQAVTLDYGGRSVDDFLLHYGFVPHRCFSDSMDVATLGENNSENNVLISWKECQGYQGHAKEEVRKACSSALLMFPTTIEEDVTLLNQLSGERNNNRSDDTFPAISAAAHEAEMWALNYRYAKKSLLTSALGMEKTFSPSQSAFAASSFSQESVVVE